MVGEGGFALLVVDPVRLHLIEILYGIAHFLSPVFVPCCTSSLFTLAWGSARNQTP